MKKIVVIISLGFLMFCISAKAETIVEKVDDTLTYDSICEITTGVLVAIKYADDKIIQSLTPLGAIPYKKSTGADVFNEALLGIKLPRSKIDLDAFLIKITNNSNNDVFINCRKIRKICEKEDLQGIGKKEFESDYLIKGSKVEKTTRLFAPSTVERNELTEQNFQACDPLLQENFVASGVTIKKLILFPKRTEKKFRIIFPLVTKLDIMNNPLEIKEAVFEYNK